MPSLIFLTKSKANTTPSIIASGRAAHPGTYTFTGITLSIPPSTFGQLWNTQPVHPQVPTTMTAFGLGI